MIPMKAANAVGKNYKMVLMIMMAASSAAATASATVTTGGLGKTLMKGLKKRLNPAQDCLRWP